MKRFAEKKSLSCSLSLSLSLSLSVCLSVCGWVGEREITRTYEHSRNACFRQGAPYLFVAPPIDSQPSANHDVFMKRLLSAERSRMCHQCSVQEPRMVTCWQYMNGILPHQHKTRFSHHVGPFRSRMLNVGVFCVCRITKAFKTSQDVFHLSNNLHLLRSITHSKQVVISIRYACKR